jgi:hypothetical protein
MNNPKERLSVQHKYEYETAFCKLHVTPDRTLLIFRYTNVQLSNLTN